jgi:PAS domain S-box-containing protein
MTLPTVTLTKATLVHLSHTLEDVVLTHKLPALIFTGFQESSHWREETERYRELAEVAQQVCIFAGKPLPPESAAKSLHIELRGDDPLRQEWFLVILSQRFSVLLCGQDNLVRTENEATREFATFWTFNSSMIDVALNVLEEAIKFYRPDKFDGLQKARREFPPASPDADLVTELTLEMVRFEEKLNRRQRQMFAQVATSEERFQQVISSITHHIYMMQIDPEGEIRRVYASPKEYDLTRYRQEEIEKDPDFWLDRIVHSEDRSMVKVHLERLRRGMDSVVKYRIVRADGQMLWVEDSARSVIGRAEQTRLVYGVINDITEQLKNEEMLRSQERLRVALEHERDLNAIKNQLMTLLTQEFRAPLATILSATEIADRHSGLLHMDEYRNRLKMIRTQMQGLSSMLDDIAAVMRSESGRIEFKPTQQDLYGLLEKTINDVRSAMGVKHQFKLERYGEIFLVPIDEVLMRQVIVNLLVNAIKYSPEKSEIRCIYTTTSDNVKLQVYDQGIGIPEEDLPYIFEPFHRARNAANLSGTGLGLKIVKDFVELHYGTVICESAEGMGTIFTVTLPLTNNTSSSPS